MAEIAIIGAGGFVLPLRLIGDLLSFPELRDSAFALMDVELGRAERTARDATGLADDRGEHSDSDRGTSVYEGGIERVRTEIMNAFGYFHTESSHHASEYLPFFRKDAKTVLEFIPRRWD